MSNNIIDLDLTLENNRVRNLETFGKSPSYSRDDNYWTHRSQSLEEDVQCRWCGVVW